MIYDCVKLFVLSPYSPAASYARLVIFFVQFSHTLLFLNRRFVHAHSVLSQQKPMHDIAVSIHSSDENLLLSDIPLDTHKGVPFHYLPLRRPELYNTGAVEYDIEIPWAREHSESVQQFFRHRACYYDNQMSNVYNGPGIAAGTLANLVMEKNVSMLYVCK